ncbi:MAG: Trm112 family protein [Thermoguttaceae bacterium]
MINLKLLEIIVCPVSRQPLRVADQRLIDRLNQAISAGLVMDRAGRHVTNPIQEGLLRQDGLILYPIRDNIPVLLADEGIPIDALQ